MLKSIIRLSYNLLDQELGTFLMAKLTCSDYGFECDFKAEGEMEVVLEQFGKHTSEEHGIEYSKEALMQIILRKS